MSTLPEHFMVSSTDGNLYDTRKPDWTAHPIRKGYSGTRPEIESIADLKASLRSGPYVWPGGYELVYFTADGALLCSKCTREHFRSIAWSIRNKCSDGWRVVACGYEAVNAECTAEHNPDLVSTCEHCGQKFGELA